ncbi:MAG TPA: hypothetical protein VKB53_06720 [Gammaproteobacteria bacterium]|jgi:hypothetical protein|nr:hypothetical protein [Gammaproteobacteria bacterium]HKH20563.1 hypothetical protein [Gammaproteobacteria bacterium]
MTDWLKLSEIENLKKLKRPADNADVSGKRQAEEAKTRTDSPDNPDTVAPALPDPLAGLATLAKGLDPDTGEAVPRKLAMVRPTPSKAFKAKLISFTPRRSPTPIPLVDIRCPANYGGGMKGLVFNVSQLPGLIRELQRVQAEAVARGLLSE